MEFRGFENENATLAQARTDTAETGYSQADVCPCKLDDVSHLRSWHTPRTYSLAEVRDGTGWPKGVRFQVVEDER